jgi:type IV pilus assembly protein PilM
MAFLRRNRSLLGIDLGSESVKAIEVVKDAGKVRVVGFGKVDVPTAEARTDALNDLLKHCGFKTKRVATSVSGRSVIVRFLNMMDIPDENLKTSIRFEADRYIPFDLNEVVIDCHRIEDAPGVAANEMKLLLVAVKKEVVDEQVKLLTSVGLQTDIVDVDAFAISNAFSLGGPTYEMAAGKVVALVDIGASKTVVDIVRGAESFFTREVYLGGKEITNAIAKRFGIEPFEGEQLKRQPGSREAEIAEAVLPSLEDLGNEIQLSFDYYENQSDSKVEEVFVSGGGSRVAGLEDTFERIFERRTMTWNPVEGFELDEKELDHEALLECAPALGVAAGLAARAGT